MKPVEFVSIGGYVFSLEDDACSAARSYLDELSSFYSTKESGNEVMEGIEERMSELLLEQCGEGGVVSLPMVETVIATLGRPEAIEEESRDDADAPKAAEGARTGAKREERPRRKLYRDPSEGKLAGVCSGLGAFFGLDPTIFRVVFVIFTLLGCGTFFHRGGIHFGNYSFPLLYAILWICMPVAKTVRQRDELHGEKGTVDAISARIQSSVREMGETADNVVHSDSWKGIFRFLGICIGIVFLVTGVAGVASLGSVGIGKDFMTSTFFYNRIIEEIASEAPVLLDFLSYPPLVIALAVTLAVPFIALVYGGIKLIFDLRDPKWHPGLCLLVIWLIALTVLAVMASIILFKGVL